jgi:glycosyltransferase involved in cell wall biosynthesis
MSTRPASESPTTRPIEVRVVGFTVGGWPPERVSNGIVTHYGNLRRVLRERGVEVRVIPVGLVGESTEIDMEGVHPVAHDIGRGGGLPGRAFRWTRQRVPRWREFDFVRQAGRKYARVVERLRQEDGLQVLEMEETFGFAGEVIRNCRVPVVVRLHGPRFLVGQFDRTAGDPATIRRIRREGRTIAAAAGVSSPSRDVLDRVRAFYGMPLPDARVIPMPMTPPPASDRWRLDACDRDRIVFVGRFDLVKGGDVLIEAFRRVLERRPAARLTFAGRDVGLAERGGLRRLHAFVAEVLPGALEDGRIEWLGEVRGDRLDAVRRRGLVNVVSSRFETFGNTLREAMILGCPVVSSTAGGLKEILDDGANALAVPPQHPDAMARAILRLLDDPEAAAALGDRAAADCARRYDPDAIVAETLDFYNEVAARYAAHRP